MAVLITSNSITKSDSTTNIDILNIKGIEKITVEDDGLKIHLTTSSNNIVTIKYESTEFHKSPDQFSKKELFEIVKHLNSNFANDNESYYIDDTMITNLIRHHIRV